MNPAQSAHQLAIRSLRLATTALAAAVAAIAFCTMHGG